MYDILNVYLENGLRVVMHKIPHMRTMACGIWIKQGSQHETDETNGLSHLLEHLMLNIDNNNNPKFQKLIREVASEGIIYNAATTKETTSFYLSGLSRTLEKSIETLASIVIDNKGFSEELFENEKKVVSQETVSFYSSFNQIKERTSQALWGNVGIGRIIVGGIENVKNSKLEDINKILDGTYTPENSVIVVVGGIDYDKTLEVIEKNFAGWKDNDTVQVKEMVDVEPGLYCNISDNGKSSAISIGFRIPGYMDNNRINVDIISKILGDSSLESRLTQEIRMKRGLAYNLGSFTSFYKDNGTLGFTAVCNHKSVNEVIEIMMNEFNKVKHNGFTDNELNRAKKIIETRTLLELDNSISQLKYLGKCSSYGQLFSLEQELRNIQKIKKDDIENLTQNIFNEESIGLAFIGNGNIDEIISLLKFS